MKWTISHFKFFLFLLLLYSIPNIMNPESPFYEDGVYKMYAESMIQDMDYNIINQDSPKRAWMVTENFFHSDAHPLVQTPLLVLFYLVEHSLNLFFVKNQGFRFFLTSFLVNVILIFLGLSFCRQIAKRFNFVVSTPALLFFSFSSTFFYFSFFYYNVIEIFCFPFVAYLWLAGLRADDDDNINNIFEMCSIGASIGILLSVKLTYFPVCIFALYKIARALIINKSLDKFYFLGVSFSLIYFSSVANRILHFGENIEYSFYVKYMCDYSFIGILESLTIGFFGLGGLFYSNPAFLISLWGLIKLAISYWKKIDIFTFLMLGAWLGMSLFQTVPIVGYILDDHLVGRLNLTALPLLIIGFCFFYETSMKSIHKNKYVLFFSLLVLWQCFNLISYIGLKTQGHYYNAGHKVISWELIPVAYNIVLSSIKLNFQSLLSNLGLIAFFLALTTFFLKSITTRLRTEYFFKGLAFLFGIVFFITTLLNYKYSSENIVKHKEDGLYENKVVVKAGGILVYDYILDRLNAVNESDDAYGKQQIAKILDDYIALISTQIVISTKNFDRNLQEKKIKSTIYNQAEREN